MTRVLHSAAKDENINIPIVPAVATADITPGVTAPNTGDQVIGNTVMTISKSRMVPVRWNGEETVGVMNSGLYPSVNSQRFAQAMRTLVNEVEADLADLHQYASRAYGTATGTPFATASDLSDNAAMLQILEDNGAPTVDLHAVLSSSLIANIRGKQAVLFRVNESGTDQLLRRGIIGEMQGAMVHNSAQIKRPAAGTNNGSATTTAFLIDRLGHITQYVSVADRAWHAGQSCWRGRQNCNDDSVGIELEGLDGGTFEPAQYDSLAWLCQAVATACPVRHVAGHEHIAPGRKPDPGPGFDWPRLQHQLGWPTAWFAA